MRYLLTALVFLVIQVASAFGSELWFQTSRGMGMGARSFGIFCGEFPHKKRGCSLRGVKVLLKDYANRIRPLKIKRSRRGYCVRVPAIFNGNYTLVAYKVEKTPNGTIYYYAKANFYVRHQKEAQAKNPNDDLKPFGKQLRLELIRWRKIGEEPFFISRVGRKIRFKVYFDGKPAQGVRVRITTASGWSKVVVSDKDGNVVFTAIEDRFPAEKYRWRPEIFLVTAQYQKGNDKFISTYPVYAYMSPDSWRSKSAGIIILLITVLIAGIWAYFKRRENRY